jgi:energy-converting hydrogenase Eha subunit E
LNLKEKGGTYKKLLATRIDNASVMAGVSKGVCSKLKTELPHLAIFLLLFGFVRLLALRPFLAYCASLG